ncbi:hypothetical protein HN587_03270 [Candidatus Woesearchaeota archaeon]|jgi:L-lactate dehydrogenase|nr:hypothetical protein [Candidatus Woesearchaeota archaeon]
MNSVGIIGLGNIGVALSSVIIGSELVDKLKIYSRNYDAVKSYSLDLDDFSSTLKPATNIVACNSLEELLDVDVTVICVRADFKNGSSKDSRIQGLKYNLNMIKNIAKVFKKYSGTVLMVTNPVDLMCRYFFESSGLNSNQIYGIGSNLDTQRYQTVLSSIYGVPIDQISGQVIGEHGDSMVLLFSSTLVEGGHKNYDKLKIKKIVSKRSSVICQGAGRTRYGPAGVTLRTLKRLMGIYDGVEQISTFHEGIYVGLPISFSNSSSQVVLPNLSQEEQSAFEISCAKLRTVYGDVA